MGARSGGRAVALQLLFALDATGQLDADARATLDVDAALTRYWRAFEDTEVQTEPIDPDARAFAEALVRDFVPRADAIDEAIRKASTQWRLERMPRVDRNVVRLAAFELIARPDVPRAVSIDEAVELAKHFGGEDSAAFVNGVLERIADDAGRQEPRRPKDAQPRGRRRGQ
jgi:N utilization substance protein B